MHGWSWVKLVFELVHGVVYTTKSECITLATAGLQSL